jgi:hypothetical protein
MFFSRPCLSFYPFSYARRHHRVVPVVGGIRGIAHNAARGEKNAGPYK